ncbi:tetratricopeptide repeat protein [Nostoc sp.]|uniref:tetratricopeptide repeat protein n=1 Tax=Nostoc sp. TaxID=1180 RepID=UPI002FFD4E06
MNLIAMGSPEEAVMAYRQAVKIQPDADNYNNLAETLFKIGKREEAIAAYREALKINPKSYQAYNLEFRLKAI